MRMSSIVDPPLGKDRLLLQLYTRLHAFNYEFSKISWGWAHRVPSPPLPRPLPAQSSPSIIGSFAPSILASPSIHPVDMFIHSQQPSIKQRESRSGLAQLAVSPNLNFLAIPQYHCQAVGTNEVKIKDNN